MFCLNYILLDLLLFYYIEKSHINCNITSGPSRKNEYPNGDVVINNTVLYCVKNYKGNIAWDSESKEMKFFDINQLPSNQNDADLIEVYKNWVHKSNNESDKS